MRDSSRAVHASVLNRHTRSRKVRDRIIFGAVGTICAVLVGALLFVKSYTPAVDEDSTSSSAAVVHEAQIRATIRSAFEAISVGDWQTFDAVQCSEQRTGDQSDPENQANPLAGIRLDSVESVVISGETATAETRHHTERNPGTVLTEHLTMKWENGDWTLC